jgi:hypothetical protein
MPHDDPARVATYSFLRPRRTRYKRFKFGRIEETGALSERRLRNIKTAVLQGLIVKRADGDCALSLTSKAVGGRRTIMIECELTYDLLPNVLRRPTRVGEKRMV